MSVDFDKDMWLIALCAWNNVPCDSAAMAKYSDENWGKLSVDGWKRVATALEQEITRRNQSTILQPMQKTEELLDIIGKFWAGEYYPGHEEAAERITSASSAKQQPQNVGGIDGLKFAVTTHIGNGNHTDVSGSDMLVIGNVIDYLYSRGLLSHHKTEPQNVEE